MLKKIIALALMLILVLGAFAGCNDSKDPNTSSTPDPDDTSIVTPPVDKTPVTLTVVGAWEDCRAIEEVGRLFTAVYPNCTIEYECLQDFTTAVVKRLDNNDEVDIFFSTGIQADSEYLPYAQDLNNSEGFDLSNTFPGLVENFMFRDDTSDDKKMYSIPLGAEMRGMYVNKTLLDSMNIDIPTNQESLLAACATLKEAGYIPFHGNPGSFGQTLLYPWVCNEIANADDPEAAHALVESRDPAALELFVDAYEFLYSLVENNYYDYKTAQTTLNLFNESTNEDYARFFLNINLNSNGDFEKADDLGQIAFMPATLSLQSVIDKTKDDYHSEIEYVFMPAPVGEDGGFVYLSPAHGIAANKNSENLDWSIRFLNFLFQPENNEVFAKIFNVIPNTSDAFTYVSGLYDVPNERISHLGQATFSFEFYNIVTSAMVDVSKANNPKYMQTNEDGSVTLYPLEHFMEALEASFEGGE